MSKTDRRVQRTRELLQAALIKLIGEQDYDTITIQDIAERARVGRTTLYLHYADKDDLLMSCHEAIVSSFQLGSSYPSTRAALLAADAQPGMVAALRHLDTARAQLAPLFYGKDSLLLLRRLRDWSAQGIEASLRAAFPESDGVVALDLLAHQLAGAQISMLQWWLRERQPHTPEQLAQSYYRLQRAVIRDAFGLHESE
jgi:AcrR family transcriptional regulator